MVAIPFCGRGSAPFVIDPIPFPSEVFQRAASSNRERGTTKTDRPHPYHQARLWLHEIEHSHVTKAGIAAKAGLSRARVTQIMNLLELPEEIQSGLQSPPAPLNIHSFTERDLRRVLACRNKASQLALWNELVRKCQIQLQE